MKKLIKYLYVIGCLCISLHMVYGITGGVPYEHVKLPDDIKDITKITFDPRLTHTSVLLYYKTKTNEDKTFALLNERNEVGTLKTLARFIELNGLYHGFHIQNGYADRLLFRDFDLSCPAEIGVQPEYADRLDIHMGLAITDNLEENKANRSNFVSRGPWISFGAQKVIVMNSDVIIFGDIHESYVPEMFQIGSKRIFDKSFKTGAMSGKSPYIEGDSTRFIAFGTSMISTQQLINEYAYAQFNILKFNRYLDNTFYSRDGGASPVFGGCAFLNNKGYFVAKDLASFSAFFNHCVDLGSRTTYVGSSHMVGDRLVECKYYLAPNSVFICYGKALLSYAESAFDHPSGYDAQVKFLKLGERTKVYDQEMNLVDVLAESPEVSIDKVFGEPTYLNKRIPDEGAAVTNLLQEVVDKINRSLAEPSSPPRSRGGGGGGAFGGGFGGGGFAHRPGMGGGFTSARERFNATYQYRQMGGVLGASAAAGFVAPEFRMQALCELAGHFADHATRVLAEPKKPDVLTRTARLIYGYDAPTAPAAPAAGGAGAEAPKTYKVIPTKTRVAYAEWSQKRLAEKLRLFDEAMEEAQLKVALDEQEKAGGPLGALLSRSTKEHLGSTERTLAGHLERRYRTRSVSPLSRVSRDLETYARKMHETATTEAASGSLLGAAKATMNAYFAGITYQTAGVVSRDFREGMESTATYASLVPLPVVSAVGTGVSALLGVINGTATSGDTMADLGMSLATQKLGMAGKLVKVADAAGGAGAPAAMGGAGDVVLPRSFADHATDAVARVKDKASEALDVFTDLVRVPEPAYAYAYAGGARASRWERTLATKARGFDDTFVMRQSGRGDLKPVGAPLTAHDLKHYVREMESVSGLPILDTQRRHIVEALRHKEFMKLDPVAKLEHSKTFGNKAFKDRLITEWETHTGRAWPQYEAPVLRKDGSIFKKAGDPYDAHHIIPQQFSGPHEWWNMHPVKFPEHQTFVHGSRSVLNEIAKKVGGK